MTPEGQEEDREARHVEVQLDREILVQLGQRREDRVTSLLRRLARVAVLIEPVGQLVKVSAEIERTWNAWVLAIELGSAAVACVPSP